MKLGIGKRGRIAIYIIILNGELNVLKTVQLPMLLANIIKHFPYRFKFGIIIKGYSTLGVHYRDLQARVHEQETNFEFLVRERVLVNPIMHEQRVLKTF